MTNNRQGKTTSVYLDLFFEGLLKDHEISPTEALRRGAVVMLCEKGYKPYQNALNLKRSKDSMPLMEEFIELEKQRQEMNSKRAALKRMIKLQDEMKEELTNTLNKMGAI